MIKTYKVDGGYVVSQNDVWVQGRYESADDAKLACSVAPDVLSRLHQEGHEGLITHEKLMAAV